MLKCYQLLSGLKINFAKSWFHGYNGSKKTLTEWAETIGCTAGACSFQYLGATIGSSHKSIKFWDPIISKLKNKLDALDAESISIAGRVVLLKVVMDSIPAYWFHLFKVPAGIVEKIERLRRDFFWGGSVENSKKLHLISWGKICNPKQRGGLGLTSVKSRNLSLLGKWWWRAYGGRLSFWNKILTQCYGVAWRYSLARIDMKDCSPMVCSILSLKEENQGSLITNTQEYFWVVNNGMKNFVLGGCLEGR